MALPVPPGGDGNTPYNRFSPCRPRRRAKKVFPAYANPGCEYTEILLQERKEEIFLT